MYTIRKIDETATIAILHLPDFAAISGLSAKRDIEKKASLFLLEKLFEKPVQLLYTNEGKPYLEETTHISISHSHDKLAIIKNEKEAAGIDIELIRSKVQKVKNKFLSPDELVDARDNIEKLIVYWAAKEALYKLYGLKEIEFAEHLFIEPFELSNEGLIDGQIRLENFHKKFRLHYEKSEQYMLVYTLNEIA